MEQVVDQLRGCQESIGLPPKDTEENDPRKIIADTIGYFQNNALKVDGNDEATGLS